MNYVWGETAFRCKLIFVSVVAAEAHIFTFAHSPHHQCRELGFELLS